MLFQGWDTTNSMEYWTAIGVIFIAGVYAEFVSFCKRKVTLKAAKKRRYDKLNCTF